MFRLPRIFKIPVSLYVAFSTLLLFSFHSAVVDHEHFHAAPEVGIEAYFHMGDKKLWFVVMLAAILFAAVSLVHVRLVNVAYAPLISQDAPRAPLLRPPLAFALSQGIVHSKRF
ncbi:MAG: hypothetical protein V4674_02660 [Patescibacteria group bacterium]